jgi:uncharacterized membrane protein
MRDRVIGIVLIVTGLILAYFGLESGGNLWFFVGGILAEVAGILITLVGD